MFSLPNIEMPSISPVLCTALAVLTGTLLKEILAITMKHLPQRLHDKIFSIVDSIIGNYFSQMTLIIDEKLEGGPKNEMFEASKNHTRKLINPSVTRLKVSKTQQENELSVTIDQGVEVVDTFRGIQFTWIYTEMENSGDEKSKLFELRFHKKHWEMVQESYLAHVLDESEAMKKENMVIKLNSMGPESINLDHPSTFDTLAMDPTLKKKIIDDLDRFVKRRDFYRRVGKAWKRGYLLYGPPGTGKSSLIAAIANHLKFHVYDLDLKNLRRDLKELLISVANKSILVIEDIDRGCHNFQRREDYDSDEDINELTLSGLLNFVDGLWSSCGDARIIIFTTNNKEMLDPAILRPGRMDMHIHMSYCTFAGFKVLASNYLRIEDHDKFTDKFTEIENLLRELEVTPAEIAEELMRTDEPDIALGGLIEFLRTKRSEHDQANAERETKVGEQATEIPRNEEGTEEVSVET